MHIREGTRDNGQDANTLSIAQTRRKKNVRVNNNNYVMHMLINENYLVINNRLGQTK